MIYRELLLRNSENYLYHQKLMESLRFKTEVAKLAHFKELAEEFPRSHVIRKMPLLLTSGIIASDSCHLPCKEDILREGEWV